MFSKKMILIPAITLISILIFSNSLYAQVKIAVLDSGCSNSIYFKARSFTSLNVNNDPIAHGTKICQIIKDKAPLAKIYFAQVCENKYGTARPDAKAIAQAIRWSMQENVDIINLSLTINYDKDVEKAMKEAYFKKGIIFIVAAGNKAITDQFAARDGFVYLKQEDSHTFPASLNFVIPVAALDRKGMLAQYSQANTDIFERGFGYGLEGTSIACAFISAKICNILPKLEDKSLPALKSALLL